MIGMKNTENTTTYLLCPPPPHSKMLYLEIFLISFVFLPLSTPIKKLAGTLIFVLFFIGFEGKYLTSKNRTTVTFVLVLSCAIKKSKTTYYLIWWCCSEWFSWSFAFNMREGGGRNIFFEWGGRGRGEGQHICWRSWQRMEAFWKRISRGGDQDGKGVGSTRQRKVKIWNLRYRKK